MVIAQDMKPVVFRLGPGHTLRGRVVNRQGKPLDEVTIQAMNWNGHSSLDWTTRTDAEGRFHWNSAPPDPVLLTLTRPGYVMVGQREFKSGPDETRVTMFPPLRLRGRVVDAQTGQRVLRFTVVYGTYDRFANRDGQLRNVNWERVGPTGDFIGGQYEVEYAHPVVVALALRIEAEGYLPVTSQPYRLDSGDVAFDARLTPGSGPAGIVHGYDGRPLAGATVILSTRSTRAQLYNGKFHEGGYPQVVTGPEGRFSLPPQTEPYRVFVDHVQGFAEVDEKACSRDLRCSPSIPGGGWRER